MWYVELFLAFLKVKEHSFLSLMNSKDRAKLKKCFLVGSTSRSIVEKFHSKVHNNKTSTTYLTHQHWNIYPISVANRQLFFHYKILVITNWRRKNNNKKVTKIKSTSFIQTFVLIFKKRMYYGRLKKVFLKLLLEFCSGWIADVKYLRANVDELKSY